MDFKNKIGEEQAIGLLKQSGNEFITLFQKRELSVEIYKPEGLDRQSPHDRDEFYLVISGEGRFQLQDKITPFSKGDFLYVPAHASHRFVEFSEDFITWVFFVGEKKESVYERGKEPR